MERVLEYFLASCLSFYRVITCYCRFLFTQKCAQ